MSDRFRDGREESQFLPNGKDGQQFPLLDPGFSSRKLIPILRKLVCNQIPGFPSNLRAFRNFRETFRDWPQFGLTTILGVPPVRVYRLRNGQKLWLRTRSADFVIADEIMRQQIYTSTGCEIRPDDVVLDIGAHIGIFSVFASQSGHRGLVVALEPHPDNFQLLLANLRLNNCCCVLPLNLAAGGQEGQRPLFISSSTVLHSFYVDSAISLNVQTITLPQILARAKIRKVDFLKMDCEGAEYEILASVPERILKTTRVISLEYHEMSHERNREILCKFLRERGFNLRVNPDHRIIQALNSATTEVP